MRALPTAVRDWYNAGSGVVSQAVGRMLRAGAWSAKPTAAAAYKGSLANDSTGLHVCQPSGSGYAWLMPGHVKVRKNSTGDVYDRARLNLIEGSNITLTVGDDATNDEVGITIAAAAASTDFTDDVFRIQDDGDNTKEVAFEASGITTGTTRTLTVQDANGTIALTADIPSQAAIEEYARDALGTALTPGNNIDITVDDGANTITIAVETLALTDISDVTASAAEVNVLSGIPVGLTATELGYIDGVTGAIQTQLDAKQATDALLDDIAALSDPNADRILFWDDSDGNIGWLTVGSNLTITDTTIAASGGSGSLDVEEGGSAVVSSAAAINFDSSDFNISDEGSDVAGVALNYGTGSGQPAEGDHTHAGGSGALVYITGNSFTTASAVNVDSCFSGTYRNYKIIIDITAQSAAANLTMRLRASSTDDSGSDYFYGLYAVTSVTHAHVGGATQTSWLLSAADAAANTNGIVMTIFRPQLSDETSYVAQTIRQNGTTSSNMWVSGGMHDDVASYDGFSLIPASGNITGVYRVYGIADS